MAINAFIKIEGIDGASVASKHKGEIDVLSFSWGIKNETATGGPGGGGAGKAVVTDFSFTKEISGDSPELFVSVCTGEHHKEAVLLVEGVGADVKGKAGYYKVVFNDVLISSVSLAGQDNSVPMEQVSLSFSKVSMEFRDGSGAGGKAASCDFSRGGDF